ncbi:MAG: hypothetical protein ICV65_01165 [Flavisolibacter sp.]|nr:hypothetical protein [Flavisolibacter sp.]
MAYDEELADRIREALAHVPVARTYNRSIAASKGRTQNVPPAAIPDRYAL